MPERDGKPPHTDTATGKTEAAPEATGRRPAKPGTATGKTPVRAEKRRHVWRVREKLFIFVSTEAAAANAPGSPPARLPRPRAAQHAPSGPTLNRVTTNTERNMFDVKACLAACEEKMEMSVMHLEDVLATIRAGKANVHILDAIRVDSYGSMVPSNNVAAETTPDARTIAIKPWDKSMFRIIEKAIIDSEVGIMPENNGEIIRLGIPPLTEERRRQLSKQCGKEAEEAKVSVRNTRRDGNDKLKKAIKDGLSEDLEKDAETQLQKLHDKFIKRIDEILAAKEKEIMTV